MKKTLCSLICLGALSLNADVLVGVDILGSNYKDPDGLKLDDNLGVGINLVVQDFKINDADGITGMLKIGHRGYETDVIDKEEDDKFKLEISNFYFDLLAGYGLNLSTDGLNQGVNLLIGFHHIEHKFKPTFTVIPENGTGDPYEMTNKFTLKTNALKAGVSYFGIAQNNIFLNAEVFAKMYLDDKRNKFVDTETGDKKDSKFKIEGNITAGYKVNGAKSGVYIGAKIGYFNDIGPDKKFVDKGLHYGINIGYMF